MEMEAALQILFTAHAQKILGTQVREALGVVLQEIAEAEVVVESPDRSEIRIIHPRWVKVITGPLEGHKGYSGINAKEK